MSKYLFLDIDGVLLTMPTLHERGPSAMDEACVARLARIVVATKCQIVISSSWRVIHTLRDMRSILMLHGFPFPDAVIAKTPYGTVLGDERGHEIMHWMLENKVSEEQVVILDDGDDMADLMHRLVWVEKGFYNGGLLDTHAEQAISLLME